ncbi:DMT family transporter [Selenihalanaerobacter shriftii]|uniref:RarD protein n=1 Tax=Selenihalanaerobacter shriftii TaxID=142842 RepID=A0A1T4LY00_9FIRM|nr:EamA family transporter [Selenihalanaerobacter shriftii]SJZ59506.1 rarD protein [Selenihalanaerobacter shriftii]
MQSKNNKLGYIFIIIAMLIWGSVGIFARFIPETSQVIVFYRVLFAFISLLLISVYKKDLKFDLKGNSMLLILAMGITLALNWIFFFKAIKTTTIASATLSYYASPIILTILSVLFLKEELTKKGIIALALGFIGITIMLLGGRNNELASAQLYGVGYGLIAATCYALFALTNKLISNLSAQYLTLLQTGIACAILLPFITNYQLPSLKSLLLLFVMGIMHTALGLILYIKGLRISKVQDVGALSYLDPVSAIFFAMIIFGEIPTVTTLIGGGLILSGSYIVVSK